LADAQAFDKELWKRQDQQATQDVLGKIYQAQTVDQMNALNQSGVLDQATAANGAVIDRAAVNAIRDGRPELLQTRAKQAGEFTDWTTTREQRPIVNGIMTDIYSGKTDQAQAALAANPNLMNAPEIQKALTDYKRKLVTQGYEDTRFTWDDQAQKWKAADAAQKEVMRPFEPLKAQSELDTAAQQREASKAQADLARAQANKIDADAKAAANANTPGSLIDSRYKELVANGPWDKGTLDTAEGKNAFLDGLKKMGLPSAAVDDVVAQVYKYYGKGAVVGFDEKGQPIRAPLGVSTALQAVGEAGSNTMVDSLFGWSRRGDQTANALDKMFGVYSTGEKNPGWQATKDNELIQKMQATLALRNQREKVLATPPEQVNYNGKNPKKQK